MTARAAHEQELFPPADWEFIQWLAETHSRRDDGGDETLVLSDMELFHWLARWGHGSRLESTGGAPPFQFHGQVAELTPHLENGSSELAFSQRLTLPDGEAHSLDSVRFFSSRPPLVLAGRTFYLLRNAPPPGVLEYWTSKPPIPVRRLSTVC